MSLKFKYLSAGYLGAVWTSLPLRRQCLSQPALFVRERSILLAVAISTSASIIAIVVGPFFVGRQIRFSRN